MVPETKINVSFPIGNFLIHSLVHHTDLIVLYIREDNPSNFLTTDKQPIKSLYVELNLRNEKYLINCSYNSLKKNHNKEPSGNNKQFLRLTFFKI